MTTVEELVLALKAEFEKYFPASGFRSTFTPKPSSFSLRAQTGESTLRMVLTLGASPKEFTGRNIENDPWYAIFEIQGIKENGSLKVKTLNFVPVHTSLAVESDNPLHGQDDVKIHCKSFRTEEPLLLVDAFEKYLALAHITMEEHLDRIIVPFNIRDKLRNEVPSKKVPRSQRRGPAGGYKEKGFLFP